LKNPLTSLRSAVETLPLAKSKTSQDRLMEVIQHDVRRLDRLISDISDASRLDAELARIQAEPIDLAELLRNMADAANQRSGAEEASVKLAVADAQGSKPYQMQGHDIRLGQVVSNLLDNARSFSPAGGTVRVDLSRDGRMIKIIVDDDGPGIRAENTERIFERFYTDRPEGEGFGNNSGLGLSISRQIIEAHGGTIVATNRLVPGRDGKQKIAGARFTIYLPAGRSK
jgi:two-component system sensor histidine kinase ChvG